MTKKQKKMLIRIIIAAVMLAALHFIPVTGWLRLALYLVTYVVIGCDIMKKAGQGILNGRVFDENFLMAVATIGAFALAIYEKSGDYNEAIAVMLFYQIGELFQSYAVGKSRKNISALMDIRPDYANIEQDGQLVQVDPDEVAIGTVIVVQPGEKVNEFEKAMGEFMGEGYPVALSAGTAALHLAMILAGVKAGDTVFCQSLTFSASANPVAYCGAKPVFIDSERETWNMDPAALRRAFALHGTQIGRASCRERV